MRKKIFSGFIISFFLIQFLSPKKTNPVAEGKSMNAPANVSAILERSLCPNKTNWLVPILRRYRSSLSITLLTDTKLISGGEVREKEN